MNIFFWRKNRVIDAFAHKLADEFYSHFSSEQASVLMGDTQAMPGKKNDKHIHKIDQLVSQTVNQIQSFRQVQKLGVYGKARVHLTFMERLQELGYSRETAQKINQIILLKTR